jgi:D-amino peptidase
MLAADLNAVIAGLFDAGATTVHVVDAHGSGNPEPDVVTAQLDPRAKQVLRDRPFDEYFDLAAPNTYDAIVAVGMHAKTGSRGFASHTYTIGIEALINGRTITESEVIGYSWGRVGVPVIMVTGDDRLREDLRTMPWIEYVITKRATAADQAVLRPVDQVHREMRAQAKRAVENLSKAKPLTVKGPIKAAVRAVPPASLALLRGVPGVNYRDNMVEFTAADFAAAYEGIGALIGVATQAFSQFYREMIGDGYRQMSGDRPDSKRLDLEFHDRLFQRWYDVESGRWSPPPAPPPRPGKKYHGAN